MILNRLFELAQRKQLLEDPAFEMKPVPYVVVVDEGGRFLGVDERRGETVTIKKTKNGDTEKRTLDRGIPRLSPRAHGSTASQGFACFFMDTLPRVLPMIVEQRDQAKVDRSRKTFWEQIDAAAAATNDAALLAVQAFGRQVHHDEAVAAQVRAAIAEKNPASGDRVTFAFHPDGGKTILERPAIRRWFAGFFKQFTAAKQKDGPIGFCTLTQSVGPLPKSHAIKLNGIPGGLPTGVSIVSFDKAAFRHYDMEGAANAAIGYDGADGYARGFQWLREDKDHHLTVGGTLFLFWTREDAKTDFIMALGESNSEQVKNALERLFKGQENDAIDKADDFYLLAVSGNSARAVIRDYLERPLGQVRAAIRKWFDDLRIADSSKDYQGQPNGAFPMWMLANATALESDRVAPDTRIRLMHAALTGGPIPESLLSSCVQRLRAEGSDGFRATRMALIKLILIRREIPVSETLNRDESHPAYLCGRLLSILEQIQYAALGDVNANVVDKFYGTFSAAPALVFARLVSNAQNHLKKLRGENPGSFVSNDRRLGEILSLLGTTPPPAQFSLQDQGRFALGFYHEKVKRFEEIADRKAAKAAKSETK